VQFTQPLALRHGATRLGGFLSHIHSETITPACEPPGQSPAFLSNHPDDRAKVEPETRMPRGTIVNQTASAFMAASRAMAPMASARSTSMPRRTRILETNGGLSNVQLGSID
jgi:hypothetical protein